LRWDNEKIKKAGANAGRLKVKPASVFWQFYLPKPYQSHKTRRISKFLKDLIDSALATPLLQTVYLRALPDTYPSRNTQAFYSTHRQDGY